MGDLIVSLILRSAKVEQKTTVRNLALVVVGDRDTGTAAVSAILNGVVDIAARREESLEFEVDAAKYGGGD
jgi:hypothetical protein